MRRMQRFSARWGYLGSAGGDEILLIKSIDASRGIFLSSYFSKQYEKVKMGVVMRFSNDSLSPSQSQRWSWD
jgi:hypothetical protein